MGRLARGIGASGLDLAIAGATTLAHVATARGLGVFRDELYYLACAEHLAFGYVDHPPLVAVTAWLARHLFGTTPLGLRVLPAIAAGVAVYLAMGLARKLGGNAAARVLTGIAVATAPIYVSLFGILSMNPLDIVLWTAAMSVAVDLLGPDEMSPRRWLSFGAIAGIGLLNKLSIAFLGLGLFAGLVATDARRHLRQRWPWLGGALAVAIASPHLVWQQLHGWPTLEFMDNALQTKNVALSPLEFIEAQVLMLNPVALPLWVGGLLFFGFTAAGRRYRAIAVAYGVVGLLMLSTQAKPYYLAPIYPVLFAGGAVWTSRVRWLPPVAGALVLSTGLLVAPLAKPILSVERYVAYARLLGHGPSTDERKEVGRLPQFFADALGWAELAERVAEGYRSLSPEDRQRACVFAQNYGQAGAIDLYGPALGLPPALSTHNNYYLWGPGDCDGEVVLIIGGDAQELDGTCGSIDPVAVDTCRDCMPYEQRRTIWLCRSLQIPLVELWPRIKNFS